MTVEELIKQLTDLPDHSVQVRMSAKGGEEVDITNVDWIHHYQSKELYALLDDYK